MDYRYITKLPFIVSFLNSKYLLLFDGLALAAFWILLSVTVNEGDFNLVTAGLAGYLWGAAGTLLWLNEARPKWLFGPLSASHKRMLGPKALAVFSIAWPVSMVVVYFAVGIFVIGNCLSLPFHKRH